MHAQPSWLFFRGKDSLWPQHFRAKLWLFYRGTDKITDTVMLLDEQMHQSLGIKKSADYHCHFEWQPAVFHRQRNMLPPVLWSREPVDWWKWDKAALFSRKHRNYRTHTTWETTSRQWPPTACPKMVYSQQWSQLIFDPGWDWHVSSLIFYQMVRRVTYWSFVKAIPYFAYFYWFVQCIWKNEFSPNIVLLQ